MTVIERKLPAKIVVLDALLRRVPLEKREYIENLLKRAEIGYLGELKVDTIWKELDLPMKFLLFHNYEIPHYQIDTLFVCPHFLLILEIKNVAGYIWYEPEKHQFLRKRKSGEIESFQSPFDQVKRNVEKIERIIKYLGINIPIHKAVVIVEPTTVIGNMDGEISIFHAIGLRTEVKRLLLKYSKQNLGIVQFETLKEHLLKLYQPSKYKPKFEIPPIRKGAICNCGKVMAYKRGFICTCGNKSKEALYQGLHDYRVLISERITNREFRDFFFIESHDAANKILKRLGFNSEGSNKNRKYLIPEDVWRIF